MGCNLYMKAISKGPIGPCSATTSSCANMLLAVVQAFRNQKMLNPMELVGLVFGLYGGLEMAIPEFFEKRLFCCCFNRI